MKYLTYPVFYLEDSDFDDSGNLITIPADKTVFILFQSLRCYHCTEAKPAFLKFSQKNPDIMCGTIQADSEKMTKNFAGKINYIYPDLVGFPSYILYHKGKKVIYDGDRTVEDMEKFVNNVLLL